jgi:vitamin B12 transporter
MMAAAVLLSTIAHGQKDSVTTAVLDDVTITANRVEQKQSSTGKVVTIIPKDKIEKSVGKTVSQLLNEQVGINIIGSLNNPGSVQTLYMRGASSGRTLILMDGIPVNDPSNINNEFDLNLVSLNDVERIEICRGAQSTMYGSDAVAGVINIITDKKDIQKPVNLKATIAGGNYSTFKGNVQVYGKVKGFSYTTRYAKLNTKGFSSAHDKTGHAGFDNDAYNGDAANASLRYDFNNHLAAKAYVQYSRYKSDVDAGVYADDKDYTIKNKSIGTGAGLEYKKEGITIAANYRYSDVNSNYFNDSTDYPGYLNRDDYFGKTQFAELYGNFRLTKNFTLLAGGDYRFNAMNQDNFGTYPASQWGPAGVYSGHFDSTMHQESLYASILFNALQGKLNIELGGRYNRHSKYGDNTTFTFNPSYKIDDHFRIFGSIASSFKAPTLYQLFSSSGEPNLKPETSINYEAGIQYKNSKINARAVYFYRNIEDGIDFNYFTYLYFNFNQQKVSGLELELNVKPTEKLNISGNYSYNHASEITQSRETFNDTTYNYVLRRPQNMVNLNIGYQVIKGLYATIGGKYVSSRYDIGGFMAKDQKLEEYFIANAYAEYQLKNRVKFFADFQNVTNKEFFDLAGYNSIPFMFTAGVTIHL